MPRITRSQKCLQKSTGLLSASVPGFYLFLLFCCNANNGWNCGVFGGNWNNTAGNSNWNNAGLPLFLTYTEDVSGQQSSPLGENKANREPVSRSATTRRAVSERNMLMKRIGYVWEEVIDQENCNQAVLDAIRAKRKTKFLKHVKENYKEYGEKVRAELVNGWKPDPIRTKVINEGTDRKPRSLKIPSLKDHFVQTAVAKVLEKHLAKRFYFYACGSLPNRGQTFAVKAVEAYIRNKKPKYAAVADIHHFYQSIKKEQVMRCLRRVFKDEKFLRINEQILDQMGDGLAIGFTVSHWYAHLVLSFVDEELKRNNPKLFLVRFMDNFVMLCGRKRTLHKAIRMLMGKADDFRLRIKHDWQVFPLKARMLLFLSYRMNYEKTILRKPLMYRMTRRFKTAKNRLNAHAARTIMSYRGILKFCDSYHFRQSYLYPNVSLKMCRRLISNADKRRLLRTAA